MSMEECTWHDEGTQARTWKRQSVLLRGWFMGGYGVGLGVWSAGV